MRKKQPVRLESSTIHSMKLQRTLPQLGLLATFLILVLSSGACTQNGDQLKRTEQAIASFAEAEGIDSRLTPFDISVTLEGDGVRINGEVGDPETSNRLIEALRITDSGNVSISLNELPDDTIGNFTHGLVSVSVGNVRSAPRHPAQLVTQVLMGSAMRLLKKQDGWYYVQGPDQYLGWLEGSAMELVDEAGLEAWSTAASLGVVNLVYTQIRVSPDENSAILSDAVIGGKVHMLERTGEWLAVSLPDRSKGFVHAQAVTRLDDWNSSRRLNSDSILSTANTFLGIPYLWGGTSPRGFDCSGFTKTVFALNGLDLLRDADQQARMGVPVDEGDQFSGLQVGDLLFFGQQASAENAERITHVAIYIGGGRYIHATPGRLRINSLLEGTPDFNEGNLRRYIRSRRLL